MKLPNLREKTAKMPSFHIKNFIIKNINNAGLRKIHTVFGKLIFSYCIVVMLITLTLGVVFYHFFASLYNREVEKVHQKMLEQVADTIQFRIMEPVMQCFLDLSTDYSGNSGIMFAFTDPLPGNHYKLYQTCDYLRKITSRYSGEIHAIHVYYKKENLIVSSSSGVSFLTSGKGNYYQYPDWIRSMTNLQKSSHWMEPRKAYFKLARTGRNTINENVFTFVRSYPLISKGTDYQGLIAIEVSENSISDIIRNTIPSQCQNTFIINKQGQIISHPDKNLLYRRIGLEKYIQRILRSGQSYDSFTSRVHHQASMVTFTSLPYTGWKVVNITPTNQFYQSTRFLRMLLVIVCILVILIGLAISVLFTHEIYNPLDILIHKMQRLPGAWNMPAPQENEYGFINRFIDDITTKVQSLQDTQPVLQKNFIMGLLYHQFFSDRDLSEKSKLLDANFKFPYYEVILLQLDEAAVMNVTLEESQIIHHFILSQLQHDAPEGTAYIGIDLPDCTIGVIVGAQCPDNDYIRPLLTKITTDIRSRYGIAITVATGRWTDSLFEIHSSFKDASLLFKYKYFYSQEPLLHYETFLKKESSQASLPGSIILDFSEGLRKRSGEQITAAFRVFGDSLHLGDYSAHHCRQKLLEMTQVFSAYLKDMQYPSSEKEQSILENPFTETAGFEAFKSWISEFANRVFQWSEMRTTNRSFQIVEKTVNYLGANLHNDLSLEAVAEKAGLSPSYFSKIFKEIMGVAFTTYLTDLRILKARDLLIETDLSVQEIGFKVGYNTPAYFIKQFKSKFGYTPSDFRRQYHKRINTL